MKVDENAVCFRFIFLYKARCKKRILYELYLVHFMNSVN